MPPGCVAVGELVLADDGFAALAVDALVDALGDAHPPWCGRRRPGAASRSWENGSFMELIPPMPAPGRFGAAGASLFKSRIGW